MAGGIHVRSASSGRASADTPVLNIRPPPQAPPIRGPSQQLQLHAGQSWLSRRLQRLGGLELSYRTCCVWFATLACVMALVPIKDYLLGSYVTEKFDEVRDDVVARKPSNFELVTSRIHSFDTFGRNGLPLFDMLRSGVRMTRNDSRSRSLVDFLVYTSVRRADLIKILPEELLSTKVSVMDDFYAPLCGLTWQTDAQLVFGHYFPEIRHEFCREFGDIFSRNRFFTSHGFNSLSPGAADGTVLAPLGVIGLVNMSEVYLRHFHSREVVRTLTRSVLSGFLGGSDGSPWQVNFSDATADAVVERYAGGITITELISLLPDAGSSSIEADRVRLVDLVGINEVLKYFLSPQQLTMGSNINSEAAVIAEVSYATTSVLTLDFLVTMLGMGPVFSMYMAPFWNCAIELTTMDKDLALDTVDPELFYVCGVQKAALVPVYTVNLLYLTQNSYRDYGKLDNSSLFVVGRRRVLDFDIPEKLESSPLLMMDGNAWSKVSTYQQQLTIPPTPYGYVYTHDCQHLVDEALAQQGRNVKKYQAFIGDGMGNCHFHDSQETELHVLCRLVFGADEILLRDLDGNVHTNLSACKDLAPLSSFEAQNSFRQIEWFLLDTTALAKRTRIRDNTSRQIRTLLLFLGMAGSIFYIYEYLVILKSVWVFTRNGLQAPRPNDAAAKEQSIKAVVRTIALHEFLRFDPAVGALQRPISVVLLYLGVVGALSNIFSLACHAEIASEDGKIVIYCVPSIAITSISLCFTALSSGFWVALITQQTRRVSRRLRSQADPHWIRKWALSHATVLLIYASLKIVTDLVTQNVLLRSDPHFYAIGGGVVMTLLISLAFRVIHYSTGCWRSSSAKVVNASLNRSAWNPRGHQLSRYPSFSARTATIQERDFLSRWNANQLDGVLQECATPTIALELVWYASLRRSYLRQAPLTRSTSGTLTPRVEFVASDIRVHEFVAVHIAACAWKHLETLAWSYDAHGQLTIRLAEGSE